jgi:transcriptional regulator with XRE-family HTH domain
MATRLGARTFGARVREARVDRRRLTQEQLAKELGINKYYLSRIERGERMPADILQRRMADALKCSVGWLLGEGELPPAEVSANKRRVMASDEYASAPDEVKSWFATLHRWDGGDLSEGRWYTALTLGIQLFELGLMRPAK